MKSCNLMLSISKYLPYAFLNDSSPFLILMFCKQLEKKGSAIKTSVSMITLQADKMCSNLRGEKKPSSIINTNLTINPLCHDVGGNT